MRALLLVVRAKKSAILVLNGCAMFDTGYFTVVALQSGSPPPFCASLKLHGASLRWYSDR